MPDLRNRFVAFPVTSRGLICNTICCVIIENSFFTWVRFLYAPLLYLAYFTLLIIAYVSNISAYFTIMVLRPCVLYGNKPGNLSLVGFSSSRLLSQMSLGLRVFLFG